MGDKSLNVATSSMRHWQEAKRIMNECFTLLQNIGGVI